MPYCMFRLYRETTHDESRFERARTDLLPKLRAIPGFIRWAGMQTEDGRYGGFHAWETQQAAQEAAQTIADVLRSWGNQDALALAVMGEIGLVIVGRADYDHGYGVARIYRTSSTAAEVDDAIEHEAAETIRAHPGLLRYTTARLEDGRFAVFSAYDSAESARALTEKAREMRNQPGSRLGQALPTDPEVIMGKIPLAIVAQKQPEPA